MLGSSIAMMAANNLASSSVVDLLDDVIFTAGTDSDIAYLLRASTLAADTALTSVLIGTPESQAIAADSLMISNVTASGDIAAYVNKGGASQMVFWADGSSGDTAILAASGASIDAYIAGTKVLDYASGAFAFQASTTISSTGTLTINAFTLGGAITMSGQALNAGAGNVITDTTGGSSGLLVRSTNDGAGGATIFLRQVSASPANNDAVGILVAEGKDDGGTNRGWAEIDFAIESVLAASYSGKMVIYLAAGGVTNSALTLSSLGELGVDASGDSGTYANVELFDDYDDALVLRQGVQQRNRELLANLGVLKRKDTGSGYMMQIQPMVRLLAGGIYQTRQMLEETRDALADRLSLVEQRLLLLPEGRNG